MLDHVCNRCYGGSDRKRPRLESQSSEEEENDNIGFINMAIKIKKEKKNELKHMFKNTKHMSVTNTLFFFQLIPGV